MTRRRAPASWIWSSKSYDELVDVEIDRRAVHDRDVGVVDAPAEPADDAGELGPVLLQGDEDAGLVPDGAGEHEVQAHEGLPGTGWPGDEGGGARPVAVLEGVVERRDPRRHPLTGRVVGEDVAVQVGQSWEHDQSAGGDAVDVVAGQEVTPAQLARR